MEPQIPTKQGPLLCVSFFILPSHHFPSQHRPCYSFVLNTAQTVETVCLYHFIGAGSPSSLRRKVRPYTLNSSWRRSITSFSMSAVLARAAQVRGRNASHTNKTMASERRERESKQLVWEAFYKVCFYFVVVDIYQALTWRIGQSIGP